MHFPPYVLYWWKQDSLAQAVLFRHLKVDDGAGIVQPHLDGVDHKGRAPQGFLPVFHPQVGGDFFEKRFDPKTK